MRRCVNRADHCPQNSHWASGSVDGVTILPSARFARAPLLQTEYFQLVRACLTRTISSCVCMREREPPDIVHNSYVKTALIRFQCQTLVKLVVTETNELSIKGAADSNCEEYCRSESGITLKTPKHCLLVLRRIINPYSMQMTAPCWIV